MKKLKKEDLELLSYQDIAELILKDKKKGESTIDLFTEICKLLGLSEEELKDRIGDFYTGLTIDQRFTIMKDGKWDLKSNHPVHVVVDYDDDNEEIEENFEEEPDENEPIDIDTNEDDDIEEDELEDLVVLDEEDLTEN